MELDALWRRVLSGCPISGSAPADRFRTVGADVTVVETDLANTEGVDRLWAAAAGRPVDALLANAGHGSGAPFLIKTSRTYIT